MSMEPEDGRLSVLDLDDDASTVAFTRFGIDNLKELLADRKKVAGIARRRTRTVALRQATTFGGWIL